uniref:Structure-specific endonuclease subunit SLX4 n=1 Tax=Podarcis muralis TaxID=64176 RepID=A0A670JHS2_PODMU
PPGKAPLALLVTFPSPGSSAKPPEAPPTPMPSYSVMETPKLKKELHRWVLSGGGGQAPLAGRERLQHLPLSLVSSQVWSPCSPKAEDDLEPPAAGRLQGTASLPTGFPTGGSTKDSAPTASQESTASSGTGSDVSVASQSSSSMEFGSLVEEEEEEHVPASQAAAREAHKVEALRRHLTSKPALCRQILLYQPIELAGLQAELKESGVKIAMGKLMDFLDAHCITFTTAEARREKQQHSKKRRRRF